jgi:hypothetical protein
MRQFFAIANPPKATVCEMSFVDREGKLREPIQRGRESSVPSGWQLVCQPSRGVGEQGKTIHIPQQIRCGDEQWIVTRSQVSSALQRHRINAMAQRGIAGYWLGSRCLAVSETNHSVCLWSLLAFDDIKLDIVAFFQRLVSVQLNCRVVNEHIRSIFTSDEAVSLGVVKPLDLSFVLSHGLLPFFFEL